MGTCSILNEASSPARRAWLQMKIRIRHPEQREGSRILRFAQNDRHRAIFIPTEKK